MNRIVTICLSIFTIILSVFFTEGCSEKKEQQPLRHRLIFNCDGSDLIGNYVFHKRPLSLANVNAYVDAYANSQVTTYMVCSGSEFFHYRSKYGRVFGDDLNGSLDCGCDTAQYRNLKNAYRNHLNLEEEGTDIIDASLRRAKQDGMETFITYRMNDLHFNDTTLHCPVVYPDYWINHPEYWINENIGWHSAGAFDFSYKEVREHKLDIITEQLEKYGALLDGYDLDFMRFIVYFKTGEGEKNAPLITEMVKAVRAEVDKQSAENGKKILLSARVPVDLDFCLEKGLDVKKWIQEGLLDFVSIGVHWIGNPSIPVAKFKEELGCADIPVYVSVDDGGYWPRELYSDGMFRGMASHIFVQGGDGIYLFNFFFDDYQAKYNGQLHLEEGSQVCRVMMPGLLNELGSPETLHERNKIYCLDDGHSAAYGYQPDTPLPLTVSAENKATATIYIGDDTQKDKPEEMILFIRTDKPAPCSLWVNGIRVEKQKPEYVQLYDRGNNLQNDENVYAFILPATCLKQGENEVGFQSPANGTFKVKRLEVALKYGDVKTHGYF